MIPKASIKRILKKAGANRVSESAVLVLKEITEEKIEEIAVMATRLALHSNRKTVRAEDIKLATRKY